MPCPIIEGITRPASSILLMGAYRDKHLPWARQFLARHDPRYRFRWDVYFDELDRVLREARSFLDAGCGDNRTVNELPFAGFRIGVDIATPANKEHFCVADLEHLPFAQNSFDAIGCRFVLEHLAEPEKVFHEFFHLLRPGGYLLTQTSNRRHPLVFAGRLLPFSIKRLIMRLIYGHAGGTDFPTYHRLNRPRDFRHTVAGLTPVTSWHVEDLHLESKPLFYLSYAWHWLTGALHCPTWRSSITTLWRKPVESPPSN